MAINSQRVALIGNTYSEITQALFGKLNSFDNVTGEGKVVTTNNVYEYFSISIGESTYRMCVQFKTQGNYNYFIVGIADSGSSGGSSSAPVELNYENKNNPSYGQLNADTRHYVYVRIFTNSDGEFVGISAFHTTTSKNCKLFLLVKCENENYLLYSEGDGYILNLNDYNNYYITTDSNYDGYYESVDSVFLEPCYVLIDEYYYPVQDLFHIWNNQLFTYNSDHDTNGFIIIGTEEGNYMAIYKDKWIAYGKTEANEVYEYVNG